MNVRQSLAGERQHPWPREALQAPETLFDIISRQFGDLTGLGFRLGMAIRSPALAAYFFVSDPTYLNCSGAGDPSPGTDWRGAVGQAGPGRMKSQGRGDTVRMSGSGQSSG